MKRVWILMGMLLGLGLSLAQQGQGGFPNLDPEMRKKLEAYQVVFELVGIVGMIADVDKQKGLAVTKAQAQKLLPILKDLQNRSDLKPADADKILVNIEDNILTAAQLKWIDKTQLERREQARQRRQQSGQSQGGQTQQGQTQQGQTGQQSGQRPQGQGGPGGRGGIFQAIQQGKPYNPFKEQQRTKDQLVALVALLQKK